MCMCYHSLSKMKYLFCMLIQLTISSLVLSGVDGCSFNVNPIQRVSFEMLNSPDNVYMMLQPQPNLYNITIYETQNLPSTLLTVKYYNGMVVIPASVTTRLVNLISTVDQNSIRNFCKHLQPQLLQNMVDGALEQPYQPYQNTVNLVLFTRCAGFWGDANLSTASMIITGLCATAVCIIGFIL